eukprot:6187842-Pleurochrysis_carterae.AAC.3
MTSHPPLPFFCAEITSWSRGWLRWLSGTASSSSMASSSEPTTAPSEAATPLPFATRRSTASWRTLVPAGHAYSRSYRNEKETAPAPLAAIH